MLDEPRQNARPGRMLRPLARLLLSAMVACAAAACQPSGDEAVDVTLIGEEGPAITDPASGELSLPNEVLLANVAQGLVRFDAHGQIEPGLAERWNVSDDGLSYIFRLASGDWPDGRQINARDVA